MIVLYTCRFCLTVTLEAGVCPNCDGARKTARPWAEPSAFVSILKLPDGYEVVKLMASVQPAEPAAQTVEKVEAKP